jgi:hypothetical protein
MTRGMVAELFVVCAIYQRPNGAIGSMIGYRGCNDGEDAMIGRWIKDVNSENPGVTLLGAPTFLKIPLEDIEKCFGPFAAAPTQPRRGE